MRRLALVMGLLLSLGAHAEPPLLTKQEATEFANLFADCKGVYDAISAIHERIGNTASAQLYNNLGNGAHLAGMFILSADYAMRHGVNRKMGDFSDYVASRAETNQTTILSLWEMDRFDLVKQKVQFCSRFLEIQEEFIQMARDEAYGR